MVLIPLVCLAVCVLLGILGFIVAGIATMACVVPIGFFSPPEHSSFTGPIQRDAVALTRLTVVQSVLLPVLLFWAAHLFRDWSRRDTGALYKRLSPSRLLVFRLVFLGLLAVSAAITLGATTRHGAAVLGVVGTLAVSGCLGYLAWTASKRLMPLRGLLGMASPEALVGTVVILGMVMMPAFIGVCLGSSVLTISAYLQWLGPLGWLNDLLLGLGLGHAQNVYPLGTVCLLALVVGHRLNRPTSSWAFRRRLLANYRTPLSRQPEPAPEKRGATGTPSRGDVAGDLRRALSQGGWKSLFRPRWIQERVATWLLLYGVSFLTQLLVVGLVLFLASVEASSGMALKEMQQMCSIMACVVGANVLLMEAYAGLGGYWSDWWAFAQRPVSPGQVWRRLQQQGLRFVPTQVLLAIPFVALTALIAPDYVGTSCLAVAVALWACVALRTTVTAGTCYLAAITHLRQWITSLLMLLGAAAGVALFLGTLASGVAVCVEPTWTPGAKVLALLLQQLVTLLVLGIAWGVWYAVGRSGKATQPLPSVR